ncbi:MAG: hypothetical protein KJ768_03815, partial [Acidobacteria bacterium]|nr:hypothetical protein [Acidobacteriota bacterium]
ALHPDFEASTGYVNRTDYRSMGAYLNHRLYPEKKNFQQVDLSLRAGRRYGWNDDLKQDEWLMAEVRFRFTEFSQMEVQYSNRMERFGGMDFRRNNVSVEGQLMFVSWMPFGFYLETGESVWYDEDNPSLGWANTYGMFAIFKPSRRIRVGVEFTKQTFWGRLGRRADLRLQRAADADDLPGDKAAELEGDCGLQPLL